MSYTDLSECEIRETIDDDKIKKIIKDEFPNATEDQINEASERIISNHLKSMRKEMKDIDTSSMVKLYSVPIDDAGIVMLMKKTSSISRANIVAEEDADKDLMLRLELIRRYFAERGMSKQAHCYADHISGLNSTSLARKNTFIGIDTDASSDSAGFQLNAKSEDATFREMKEFVEK